MPTHAGEGLVGKAPLLPSRGGELRTSAPVGPQFYSINCPGALVKASQPASHWHVISYQQTGQHLSLLEGGSQASSTPLPPQNRHSTKITRSHFPSEGGQDLSPVIELESLNLHPCREATLLCIRSPVEKTATLPRRCSPQPFAARHGQRAPSKTTRALLSCPRALSPWHQLPTA